MSDWPNIEDLRSIGQFFKAALRDQPGKPLREYMRRNNLDWDDFAAHFTDGELHRWATGERPLTPHTVARIKKALNIPNSAVPDLTGQDILSGAAADTLTMIRGKWFSVPGVLVEVLTSKSYDVLNDLIDFNKSKKRPAEWDYIYRKVVDTILNIGISTVDELTEFYDTWDYAHCVFVDALEQAKEDREAHR